MGKICEHTTDIRQLTVKLISEGKKQINVSSNNLYLSEIFKI